MKKLQTTLFVIAFVILGTQSFRHIYVKWIDPRSSVLDRFRDPIDTAIASAASLSELVAMYQKAHEAVREYESKPGNPEVKFGDRRETEPYASHIKLEREIEEWEQRTKALFEVRFFWSLGLVSVLLGLLCHAKWNAWLGMASIIAGFSEMAYWTSPLARAFGALPEFERLLTTKLVLSLVSWSLLVGLWLALDQWGRIREAAEGRAS